MRQPRCDTRVSLEDKRRFFVQRAVEAEQRRALVDAAAVADTPWTHFRNRNSNISWTVFTVGTRASCLDDLPPCNMVVSSPPPPPLSWSVSSWLLLPWWVCATASIVVTAIIVVPEYVATWL
jgi:hypothetical protein